MAFWKDDEIKRLKESGVDTELLNLTQPNDLDMSLNTLQTKLIYARNYTPHKVGYYEQLIKNQSNLTPCKTKHH